MAWRNDYDRIYSNHWYGGAGRDERARGGGRGWHRAPAWEEPWSEREVARHPGHRWGARYRDEGWEHPHARTRYWGARGFRDYGYDYLFRRPPHESPTYGRAADEEVRRWARRQGYDEGFTIEPRRGGGDWVDGRPRGPGRGEPGWFGQHYDWNYRW